MTDILKLEIQGFKLGDIVKYKKSGKRTHKIKSILLIDSGKATFGLRSIGTNSGTISKASDIEHFFG